MEPHVEPSPNGEEPAKPKKKSRRGSRGGRGRKKKSTTARAAEAGAGSDWGYVPMSEWDDAFSDRED